MNFIESKLVPIAAKIGSIRILVAIRDAFVSILPVIMTGSFAVLLNVFFRDLPTEWGWSGFVDFMTPLISVNGAVWWGSIAIFALLFSFAIGYQVSKQFQGTNSAAAGLVALATFIIVTPQAHGEAGWGYFHWGYFNVGGLFTALIIGLGASFLFTKLSNKGITIKLPSDVPPAVSKAFAALLPSVITMFSIAILSYVFTAVTDLSIHDAIFEFIQTPLQNFTQGFFPVLLIMILVQFFWFFGLHGSNVLAPVIETTWGAATKNNNLIYQTIESFSEAQDQMALWTKGTADAFVWMGGAGCCLALVIALWIFSRREDERAIAKVATPMVPFNINEPVMFGLPIVLNVVYLIPFILVSIVLTCTTYFATYIGLVPKVFIELPWVMPPVISGYLATGGNLVSIILSLVNLALAVLIWIPFILVSNRVKNSVIEE